MSHPRSRSRQRRPLLRWIVGGLTVAGAVLAIALGFGLARQSAEPVAFDPNASGRLVGRQTLVDLGRVAFDTPTEARFDLENSGGTVVRLTAPPRVRMLEGC
ncbi:MAG: hypothetical protein U0893_28200 [Chloroflexota bacterium]